jgi:hypothetical protein
MAEDLSRSFDRLYSRWAAVDPAGALVAGVAAASAQIADAPNALSLLRARHERPRRRAASKQTFSAAC